MEYNNLISKEKEKKQIKSFANLFSNCNCNNPQSPIPIYIFNKIKF